MYSVVQYCIMALLYSNLCGSAQALQSCHIHVSEIWACSLQHCQLDLCGSSITYRHKSNINRLTVQVYMYSIWLILVWSDSVLFSIFRKVGRMFLLTTIFLFGKVIYCLYSIMSVEILLILTYFILSLWMLFLIWVTFDHTESL